MISNIFLLYLKFLLFLQFNLKIQEQRFKFKCELFKRKERNGYYFLIHPSAAGKLKSQIKGLRVTSRAAPVQDKDQFLFLIKYSLHSFQVTSAQNLRCELRLASRFSRKFRPDSGRLIKYMTSKLQRNTKTHARRYLARNNSGLVVISHRFRKHDSGSVRFRVGKNVGRCDTTAKVKLQSNMKEQGSVPDKSIRYTISSILRDSKLSCDVHLAHGAN